METKDTLFTRHKNFFMLTSGISGIMGVIVLLCFVLPFVSYNPTVFETTKQEISLIDFWSQSFSSFLWAIMAAVGGSLTGTVIMRYVKNDKWKEKFKIIFYVLIISMGLIIIGFIGLDLSTYEYYVEETDKIYSTEKSVGFILFIVVSIIDYLVSVVEIWILYQLKTGKIDEDEFFSKLKKGNNDTKGSLQNKLEELSKLREQGLISNEEYEEKKKVLLEEYK